MPRERGHHARGLFGLRSSLPPQADSGSDAAHTAPGHRFGVKTEQWEWLRLFFQILRFLVARKMAARASRMRPLSIHHAAG
jgi:hypothetical protein